MTTFNRTENTIQAFYEAQALGGYVKKQFIDSPIDDTATAVMAARFEAAVFLAQLYAFTVTSANATANAVYSDAKGNLWTVVATIASQTTLVVTAASGTPPASGTLTKVSGTGDATITFSTPGSNLMTQPDVPRLLSITGAGADHDATGNVVIKIHDIRGNVVTDTIALSGNTTVPGIKAANDIISIDFTGVTGLDSGATISIGVTDALGLARILTEDSMLFATFAGVYEATRPTTVINATDISQNVTTLNSDLDGTSDVVLCYVTTEQINAA